MLHVISFVHAYVPVVVAYWALRAFIFFFLGIGEELVIFDLSGYDVYVGYRDDNSGPDFQINC